MKGFCLLAALPLWLAGPALAQKNSARADEAQLGRYATANRYLPPANAKTPRVVLMGNSILESWLTVDPAFFQRGRYEWINRGVSGQTSRQILARFRQDVLGLKPAAVVILAATNDLAGAAGPYDRKATLHNLKAMAGLAQARGIRVVLCSELPALRYGLHKDRPVADTIIALNRKLQAYARRQGFGFIDFHSKMRTPRLGMNPTYSDDGVHPNTAGYGAMEPLLLEALHSPE